MTHTFSPMMAADAFFDSCFVFNERRYYAIPQYIPQTGSFFLKTSLSIARFCMFLAFLTAIIFLPVYRIFLNLFERIIESDKPIFSLIFGGMAAIFKAVQTLIEYLIV